MRGLIVVILAIKIVIYIVVLKTLKDWFAVKQLAPARRVSSRVPKFVNISYLRKFYYYDSKQLSFDY